MSLMHCIPQLYTAPQMWPHQGLVEGKDHVPQLVGSVLPKDLQDTIGPWP